MEDNNYINQLIEKYYKGTASEAEERLLKSYMANHERDDAEYVSAKAIASYAATAKARKAKANIGRRPAYGRLIARAACVAVVLMAGIYAVTRIGGATDCEIYINGKEADAALVHNQMQSDFMIVNEAATVVDNQFDSDLKIMIEASQDIINL